MRPKIAKYVFLVAGILYGIAAVIFYVNHKSNALMFAVVALAGFLLAFLNAKRDQVTNKKSEKQK